MRRSCGALGNMRLAAVVLVTLTVAACVPSMEGRWTYKAPRGHWASTSPYYVYGGGEIYEAPIVAGVMLHTYVVKTSTTLDLYVGVASEGSSWKALNTGVTVRANGVEYKLAAVRTQKGKTGETLVFALPAGVLKAFALESFLVTNGEREAATPVVQYEYRRGMVVQCLCQ